MGIDQREDSYDAVFSNCVRYPSIRIMLALAAMNDFELFNIDVRGAYLYAKMDKEL